MPLVESLVALGLMLGGAALGSYLRTRLPQHLDEHAKDVVRLCAALVATITALVLSLMITTANSFFESQRAEVRNVATDMILLDALLDTHGPAARGARQILRDARTVLVDQVWFGKDPPANASPIGGLSRALYQAIADLPSATPLQATLQNQSLTTALRVAQTRLALYEGSRARLPQPILYLLIFWLTALFASFSLFTPLNPISTSALVLVALCAAGALFLILDMQQPFTGLMRLPPEALTGGLPAL